MLDLLCQLRKFDPGRIFLDGRMGRRLADEQEMPARRLHRLADRLAGVEVVAMTVNWLMIEIRNAAGEMTYRNSFITDLPTDRDTVVELSACGRARWKIENESFNVLKTKGYNLEHNFGHGKKHLSAVLATLNLLAFA